MAPTSPTPPYHVQKTTTSDAMDLHSDGDFGLGSGGGEIEIDLQPTEQRNDDLSIYDAASDTGLAVQTVPADEDDFMVDDDDVIVDDTVNYDDNDVQVADAEEPANVPVAAVENDEDLIDYSDDEEDSTWTGQKVVASTVNVEADDVLEADDLNQALHGNSAEPAGSDTQAQAYQHESDTGLVGDASVAGSRAHVDDFEHFDEQPEELLAAYENSSIYNDSTEEVKVTLEDDSTHPAVDSPKNVQDEAALIQSANQANDETQLPPVTVNYDGAELWLFKSHDYENSGDYLVEDEGLVTKPLKDVLAACREPLGSDVGDDIELGFRLDNLYNIELYQEHSSCAFITLQTLLNLYHQLHAQDGVSNPESFYMTLLFRPRVSSLISALQNAAAEGIGHSGMDRAIADGLTAFTARTSHNSTEPVLEEWADGGEQQEQELPHADSEEQVDGVEGNAQLNNDTQDEYGEEQHHDDFNTQNVPSTGPAPATPAASVHNGTPAAEDRSSAKNAADGSQPLDTKSTSNSTHASPTSHNDDDDILDYSDDEVDEAAAHTSVARATPSSSSSSTVQGDLSNAQDQVEARAVHEQDNAVDEASNRHAAGDVTATNALHEEYDDLYEGFDESYNEDHVEEHAHVVGITSDVPNYPEERPTHTEDVTTNQYDDAEHENGAPRLELPLDATDEHGKDAASPPAFLDNLLDEGEFADVDGQEAYEDLWADEHTGAYAEVDEIGFDDEDGAAGQAPVAASAAAQPGDTLSSELFELSPQGQKRTIDEAAIDADGATDSSDVKRPRV